MKDEFNHVEIDGKEADDIQVKMDDVVADAEAFTAEEKAVQPERNRRGGAKPVPVMEEPMSDEDFNEELKELMEEDTSGKKKKRRRTEKEDAVKNGAVRKKSSSASASRWWLFSEPPR